VVAEEMENFVCRT